MTQYDDLPRLKDCERFNVYAMGDKVFQLLDFDKVVCSEVDSKLTSAERKGITQTLSDKQLFKYNTGIYCLVVIPALIGKLNKSVRIIKVD